MFDIDANPNGDNNVYWPFSAAPGTYVQYSVKFDFVTTGETRDDIEIIDTSDASSSDAGNTGGSSGSGGGSGSASPEGNTNGNNSGEVGDPEDKHGDPGSGSGSSSGQGSGSDVPGSTGSEGSSGAGSGGGSGSGKDSGSGNGSGNGNGDGSGSGNGSGSGSGNGNGNGDGKGDCKDTSTCSDTNAGSGLPGQPKLYDPKYPDGLQGVWDQQIGKLKATPVFSLVKGFLPTGIDGGSPPSWTLDLNLGGLLNFGSYELKIDPSIWPILRALVIVSALLLAYKIVF